MRIEEVQQHSHEHSHAQVVYLYFPLEQVYVQQTSCAQGFIWTVVERDAIPAEATVLILTEVMQE